MSKKLWLGGTGGNTTNPATAANWSPSGVPTNSDDVYVEANPTGTDYNIDTSLATFAGVTLNSFNVSQTYTGQIGDTAGNYLQLGGTNSSAITVNIGYQYGGASPGSGSNLIRLDMGAMRTTFNITNTKTSSAIGNAGPVTLLGSHTSNTLNVTSGIVSVAATPTETATLLTVNSGGQVTLGLGCTLTTLNTFGGTAIVQSAATTINHSAGVLTTVGTGAITTLTLFGGSAFLKSTGTISTLNVYGASADFSTDARAKTVTTTNAYAGANINLNNGVKNSITLTNGIATFAPAGAVKITGWPNSVYALT